MAASEFERAALARPPGHRPDGLHPDVLDNIDAPTSFSLRDLDLVADRFLCVTAVTQVPPCYAVKCNFAPDILATRGGWV